MCLEYIISTRNIHSAYLIKFEVINILYSLPQLSYCVILIHEIRYFAVYSDTVYGNAKVHPRSYFSKQNIIRFQFSFKTKSSILLIVFF